MNLQSIADSLAAAAPVIAEVPVVVPGRRLLVDGDYLCYFAGGNEDMTTATSKAIFLRKLEAMKEAAACEKVLVMLTGEGSTKGDRMAVACTKPYQAQRAGSRRPQNWAFLRNFAMHSGHPAFQVKAVHDREADDLAGYCATVWPGSALATADKDFRMIPGIHVTWQGHQIVDVPQGCFELVHNEKCYGYKFFWWQMLRGDTADNIPGLPSHPDWKRGVGEAGATALLGEASNNQEAYEAVREAYKAYSPGNWDRLFCEQASLLWMRRDRLAHLNDWLFYLSKSVNFEDFIHEAAEEQDQRVKELKAEAKTIGELAC